MSAPAPPVSVSLPAPPVRTLLFASPVSVSLWVEPITFSIVASVSLPSAPEAVPVARLTVTADEAFA